MTKRGRGLIVTLGLGALTVGAIYAHQTAPRSSSNASFSYSDDTFSSQTDCKSYLPGGSNEHSSWPQGAIDAAEEACCEQTANEFNSGSGALAGLRCQQAQVTVACNGAKCAD